MSRKVVSSGLDFGGTGKATGLLDPTNPQDAVTLHFLQAAINGLTPKNAVRVASTANVTVTGPGTSIDGVTLANGDRVLLKNQTTASENGLYTFAGSGSALVRTADGQPGTNLLEGDTVLAAEGTSQKGTSWTLQADLTTWVQTGGTPISYSVDATGGLTLTGTSFSVKLPAGSGLIKDATGLHVDTSVLVRKFAQNFGDGAATTFTIAHGLGTPDVQVTVYDSTTGAEEWPDVVHGTSTPWSVTLTYAAAPAAGAKRVVVMG